LKAIAEEVGRMIKLCLILISFISFLGSFAAHASSSASQMADNIICYRDLIYSSAGLVTVQDPIRQSKKRVFAVEKDLIQNLIRVVSNYSNPSNVSAEMLAQDFATCRQLKSITQRVSVAKPFDPFAPEHQNLFFPTLKTSYLSLPEGLSVDARWLVNSIVYRLERCRGVDATLAIGLGVATASGLTASYCQGHGGKRWLTVAPHAYAGLGVGAAGLVGRKALYRSGWVNAVDLDGGALSTFGYGAGGYVSVEENSHSLGVAVGTAGFAMVMLGAKMNIKVLPLADDKSWILERLGIRTSEALTASSDAEAIPLVGP
jgi:hypothetical protein